MIVNKADNIPQLIYDTLFVRYGNLNWWPAKSPYEVIAGAILTQNTAWSNVEKAIANFSDKLSPQFISHAGIDELAQIIRPSGFFNQKARYLKEITAWFGSYNYDIAAIRRKPPDEVRNELLSVKGVGRETADSILLYALGITTFVVDAYTMRLVQRFPLDAGSCYEQVKSYFESHIPKDSDVYKNYHALIVINGKEYCRKTNPLCHACPLFGIFFETT